MKITIGTRASKIGLVQAKSVADLMRAAGAEAELMPVHTVGDSLGAAIAGQRGFEIFTREIDEALVRGQFDVAIHDMSHVAPTIPAGLSIAAVPARCDAREAFVSSRAKRLGDLPPGARLGVSGPVRAAQLARMEHGFEIVLIANDVEANLRSLSEGELDGFLASSADLIRMGVEKVICEKIAFEKIVPAAGQGALAVLVKSDRKETVGFVSGSCHHRASGVTVRSERAFLKTICSERDAVFAAHAQIVPSGISIAGFISSPDSATFFAEKDGGGVDEAAEVGRRLAERLLSRFRS